jgi:hypothetical protein
VPWLTDSRLLRAGEHPVWQVYPQGGNPALHLVRVGSNHPRRPGHSVWCPRLTALRLRAGLKTRHWNGSRAGVEQTFLSAGAPNFLVRWAARPHQERRGSRTESHPGTFNGQRDSKPTAEAGRFAARQIRKSGVVRVFRLVRGFTLSGGLRQIIAAGEQSRLLQSTEARPEHPPQRRDGSQRGRTPAAWSYSPVPLRYRPLCFRSPTMHVELGRWALSVER